MFRATQSRTQYKIGISTLARAKYVWVRKFALKIKLVPQRKTKQIHFFSKPTVLGRMFKSFLEILEARIKIRFLNMSFFLSARLPVACNAKGK